MPLPKRNLLICFDAFGTLFSPKRPVAQQYAEVASSLGSRQFTEDEVQKSFKVAFKNELKQNPNYGKATNMTPETWWTNIINNTFKPLMNEEVPSELAPKLIQRFMSNEGYALQPGASEILRYLEDAHRKSFDRIIVGVITNSDPRVPEVFTSLGLRINPLCYGPITQSQTSSGQKWDIDFSIMSYDVGHEKPDPRIFKAATDMLGPALDARGDSNTSRDLEAWEKVYVGDEYDKDVVGAENAGWYSILIGDKAMYDDQGNNQVEWLGDKPTTESSSLLDIFKSGRTAVGFSSLSRISEWLHL